MKLMGMGLDFAGNLLFKPMDEDAVVKALVTAMEPNAAAIRSLARTTAEAVSFRGEMERITIDLGDPRAAGWAFW